MNREALNFNLSTDPEERRAAVFPLLLLLWCVDIIYLLKKLLFVEFKKILK
mgnify:CR=1 FL=1